MAYIDTGHLFKCETCRFYRNGKCNTFCDAGESYSPNLAKIPTADVVPRDEVERYKGVCDDLQYEILELLNDLHNESEYVAKKIFEEIERNIFILETPYQPLHCIPSGFIEELKEKYAKGGEGE